MLIGHNKYTPLQRMSFVKLLEKLRKHMKTPKFAYTQHVYALDEVL